MFAEFAPKVRARGWQAPIPLIPGQKRPAIFKWQVFSKRPPTEAAFAKWMKIYWNYGVGLVFGQDSVIGVDLDWTDPMIAARAEDITHRILGETPLIRIGRPPKKLALYRCEPVIIISKVYGGFELFTKSGQCVLFGIHPDTGQPYRWLTETPATIGPAELPLASNEQIYKLIDALEALEPEKSKALRRAGGRGAKKPGITTEILRALQDVEDVLAEAVKILAVTPHGRRHNTMVGAVLALAIRGFSDRVIFDAFDTPYSNLMDDLSWEQAEEELTNAIQWARESVGADDETVARDLAPVLKAIETAWNRRWRRE